MSISERILIAESLTEIEGLDKSINELKEKASEISRVAE